jgi:transcriptional regulator with XRE-family HTH domain
VNQFAFSRVSFHKPNEFPDVLPTMKNPASSIDAHVGARCQQRRLECGMSVQDVAAGISTDVDEISGMESGTIRIGPDKLMRLSRLLNVDVEYFFKGRGGAERRNDAGSDLEAFLVLSESQELMRAFVQIASPAARQQVIAFAASLSAHNKTSEIVADGVRPAIIEATASRSP